MFKCSNSNLDNNCTSLYQFAWDHASIPYDDPVWWDRLNQMRSGRNTKLKSEEEKLMVGYAGQMEDYLKRKGDYHLVILYEDLVEDPEREARKVFKLLGLSTEYMPQGPNSVVKF